MNLTAKIASGAGRYAIVFDSGTYAVIDKRAGSLDRARYPFRSRDRDAAWKIACELEAAHTVRY